jgi:hypothetical protein
MLNQQHIPVAVSEVAGLVTLDAETATQVVYLVSSVVERMVGSCLISGKIYSVLFQFEL